MEILSINQELRHVEFVDIPYLRHVNNTICLTMLSYRWLTGLVVSFWQDGVHNSSRIRIQSGFL